MMFRSMCVSFVLAILAMMGVSVSADAGISDLQTRQATSCIDGGRVAVNQDFGPNFDWTLVGIRYPGNSQCSYVRNNSGYGIMKLKVKMIDKYGNITKAPPLRCDGCSELSYGTGGYATVKIKGIARERGSDVVYKTPWRTVKRP